MATLYINGLEENKITDKNEIVKFLADRGVFYTTWKANKVLKDSDSQETILAAYEHELTPFMKEHGYVNADVINVHKDTPNVEEIRMKFLKEHTHSEDEIRFFVDGHGYFYFNLEDRNEFLKLHLVAGDFVSVPKGSKHWFDLAPFYSVKAIRIFQTKEGWVANYTNSGAEKKFSL